jgi:hypothetical protein
MMIVPRGSTLYVQLTQLAERRMVFFAGLPGTGKSLLIHQLAHLADTAGRTVHLLQWDVARPVFEASPPAARYPMERGVTHALIRKALGAWVRRAVVAWQQHSPEPRHLLIGETPLVGHRFIELARRADDSAEPLLAAPSCRFVIPVPSRDVRRFLELERERRIRRPRHDRERDDAAPHVLRELWEHVVAAAQALGVDAVRQPPPVPFDPVLYEHVYRRLLAHRHVESLPVDMLLPTSDFTVYAFTHPTHHLVPTPEEAARFIEAVEHTSPHPKALDEEMTRWYIV